ncbi:hypothetical protein PR048_004580 [Dryococelus australis]|uniref:HAT C-terminal dimerisation domain-containing protein n=1 Tax=Dryococelus australis TaxID=614101 RepID=A0ABQ9I6V0_9NEOP|nr:hypothetical protein PR048_004580 [Dryococelus australis]
MENWKQWPYIASSRWKNRRNGIQKTRPTYQYHVTNKHSHRRQTCRGMNIALEAASSVGTARDLRTSESDVHLRVQWDHGSLGAATICNLSHPQVVDKGFPGSGVAGNNQIPAREQTGRRESAVIVDVGNVGILVRDGEAHLLVVAQLSRWEGGSRDRRWLPERTLCTFTHRLKILALVRKGEDGAGVMTELSSFPTHSTRNRGALHPQLLSVLQCWFACTAVLTVAQFQGSLHPHDDWHRYGSRSYDTHDIPVSYEGQQRLCRFYPASSSFSLAISTLREVIMAPIAGHGCPIPLCLKYETFSLLLMMKLHYVTFANKNFRTRAQVIYENTFQLNTLVSLPSTITGRSQSKYRQNLSSLPKLRAGGVLGPLYHPFGCSSCISLRAEEVSLFRPQRTHSPEVRTPCTSRRNSDSPPVRPASRGMGITALMLQEHTSVAQPSASASHFEIVSTTSITQFAPKIVCHQEKISLFMPKKLTEKGKKKIDDRLMQLFTKDFQPFRIVEDEGLKRNRFCLTTDCWTSLNTDSYIGLTAHSCSVMRSAHASENLAAKIKRIVTDWGIYKKIVLAVSDNACNIKKMLFPKSYNKLCGELKINDLPKKSRRTTTESYTQWNSTYFILERLVKLEIAIRSTLAVLDRDMPTLKPEEWKTASHLCQILKPFQSVIKTISGENCSASLLNPLANGLHNVCENLLKKVFSNSVTEIVVKLQAGLNTRLGNIENTFSSPSSSEHAKKLATSAISSSLAEVIDTNSEYMGPTVSTKPNNQDGDGELNAAAKKPRGTPMSRALVEVQRYIDEDLLPRQGSPLIWWKENSQFFPHLSVLARNRLCVLRKSVPCEYLFSKAGRFSSEWRSRLSKNKTKMLLFLNSNAQPEGRAGFYCISGLTPYACKEGKSCKETCIAIKRDWQPWPALWGHD